MNDSQLNDGKTPGPWTLDHLKNVGHSLTLTAERMPQSIAVAAPVKSRRQRNSRLLDSRGDKTGSPVSPLQYETITFAALESKSNRIANGLISAGIKPGMRIALMVPPGIEFVAHVFALFKSDAVVILIDPGMGRKNMIRCLSAARPEGLVGIGMAQTARFVFRNQLRQCKTNVVVGRRWWPRCYSSLRFERECSDECPDASYLKRRQDSTETETAESVSIGREQPAAIIFTTGSTGPPKGVLYRHRIFIEQAQQIRDYFSIPPGTVDVSGFPLFALFNTAIGATTVFPEMDATRPAEIHPPNLIDAVHQFSADQSFGSPALWNTVSKFCEQHELTLPGMRRVLTAGAPVPAHVLQRIRSIIAADGDAFTPYGATESLPVACNSATVILGETAARTALGKGTCVGNRFPKIDWKVIRISDQPLATIEETEELPRGEIGELIVSGAVVTDRYVTSTDANRYHKIADNCVLDFQSDTLASPIVESGGKSGRLWHRMGDVGYLDASERFWFCGRSTHRVRAKHGVMFTIPCEGIINSHPSIYRSALVGATRSAGQKYERPVLIAEPWPDKWPQTESARRQLISELRELAGQYEATRPIDGFLLHKSLPVDIRHNSKIFREQLRDLAATAE